jgi:primosomal protein N' (replication factor Y)
MSYAEVAVASDTPFSDAFTYSIPDGLTLSPGEAVLVPFGRKELPGVVLKVSEHSAYDGQTRDVLLPGERVLLPAQVELAHWLAQHYLAPIYSCVALMLPPGVPRRLTETVEWAGCPVPSGLSPADMRLAERLASSGRASPAALRRTFGGEADTAVARLVGLGCARRLVALAQPTPLDGAEARSPVRPPPLTEAQAGAVAAITRAMERRERSVFLLHGVTASGKTEVYLAAVESARACGRRAIVLVPEIALTPQTVARFEARFPGQVAVSHSGLTPAQRYRQWLDVRAGRCTVVIGARSALFLPQPDLGLIVLDEEHERSYKQQDPAPRYHARDAALRLTAFAGATAVLGSATPDVVSYHRAERGRYTLLELPRRVGSTPNPPAPFPAREGGDGRASADFAARRDRPPPPHAGPAAESAPNEGEPRGLAVDAGVVGIPAAADDRLPVVSIVDLAAELRAGNRGIFSRALDAALTATLRDGEQAILFLNRRGSASFVLCRDCGHVPRCAGCLVPFTYHAGADRLRCHHCNRTRRLPAACPACGKARIRFLGLGTQKVEEEVKQRFPQARVLRWDRDAVRTAADHAVMMDTFARREADVLVGTQMIAKGLDLPGVTLVGVVIADIALNLPDFRAGERAFQLLAQVAGRAGRGDRPGRVIIQTYSPDHYAIRAAARHDYAAMYHAEIAARRKAGYPPFGRMARLVYAHTNPARAEHEARRLAAELRAERDRLGIPAAQVIGPAPAFLEKHRGRWRWQLVLRAADPAELLSAVALPRGWSVDVDPAALL